MMAIMQMNLENEVATLLVSEIISKSRGKQRNQRQATVDTALPG